MHVFNLLPHRDCWGYFWSLSEDPKFFPKVSPPPSLPYCILFMTPFPPKGLHLGGGEPVQSSIFKYKLVLNL